MSRVTRTIYRFRVDTSGKETVLHAFTGGATNGDVGTGFGAETCMLLPRMVTIQPVSAVSFSRSALGLRSNNLERNEMRG